MLARKGEAWKGDEGQGEARQEGRDAPTWLGVAGVMI